MWRGAVLLAVAVLVVAVPAASLVWLRSASEDRLSALEPDPVAVVMPVALHQVTDVAVVTIAASWGEAAVVVAPAWFGTVTDVGVMPGGALASGDVVVRVDGIDRVAVASDEAFWRVVRRGDGGDDVAMLQRWLSAGGFYDGEVDGVFGRGLAGAVTSWAESVGVSRPDGSFDPGWVVWLSEEPFPVATVEVVAGSPAPGAGSVIITAPVPLLSVSVTDQDGRPVMAAGRWVLTVGDVEVAVVDGVVGADGLETLRMVLDPKEPLASGRIQRAEPVTALEIPATAVVSNGDGDLCVFLPNGDGFAARAVTLSGGRVSRVDVATGLSPGDEVLVNPADVFEVPVCP